MADFNSETLDAPDLAVRRIMLKRENGQRLSPAELDRLATRMSVEGEITRRGGTVKNAITPRRLTPFQIGQQDREADAGYAAGFEGRTPGTQANPAARALTGGSAPATAGANAGADSANEDESAPVAPVRRAAPIASSTGRPKGVDVNSYSGSMFSEPGSYTAAKPVSATAPQETAEQAADKALRRRFGPPPNERGQLDISTNDSSRSVKARRLY